MLGVVVGGGMHRHGLDAEFPARAQNPKGDLAAVSDNDFFDHELFDDEQRLAELDGLTVLGQYGRDPAGFVGFDLVHHFHGLDDAQYLADFYFAPDLDEGL